MRELHNAGLNIETIEFEGRIFAVEITRVKRNGHGFFLAWKEREIVVVPKNGDDVVAVFATGQPGVNHKSNSRGRILHVEADGSLFGVAVKIRFRFELDLGQRIQASQI